MGYADRPPEKKQQHIRISQADVSFFFQPAASYAFRSSSSFTAKPCLTLLKSLTVFYNLLLKTAASSFRCLRFGYLWPIRFFAQPARESSENSSDKRPSKTVVRSEP